MAGHVREVAVGLAMRAEDFDIVKPSACSTGQTADAPTPCSGE
jgi:hypothetical protein